MKKLISTTALILALTVSAAAQAAPSTTAMPPSYIDSAINSLPAKDAAAFRDTMGDAHEKNKEIYEQIHQVHEDMHNLLTAEKFDKAAFAQKSAELRKLHDQVGDNIDSAFADAVSNLPDKERMKLADSLEAKHEQHMPSKAAAPAKQ